jgi:GAF domain-containing protein
MVVGRSVLDKRTLHIADILTQADEFPESSEGARHLGWRTALCVPLMREGVVIGAITLRRTEVQLFTERQVALLQTFANQAVIAIENARLLNELRQRTDDLSESLEQQTATSEVLRVISSSPGELAPVFEAMLANAVRLCEASFGMLYRFEAGAWRAVAMLGVPPAFAEFWQRGPQRPGPRTGLGRIAATRQSVHILDAATEPSYTEGEPIFLAAVILGGFRTAAGVPMLKDENLIGAIFVYRQEVRPFADKQIELVENFARQAVIAIENARLLNELRESLQQQTATADVLQVISSSPGELEPVFQAMLENATRICEAQFGTLVLCEGDACRHVAAHGAPHSYAELRQREPVFRPGPQHPLSQTIKAKKVLHIADLSTEPESVRGRLADLAGARTLLVVPMLKDNAVIGVTASSARTCVHLQTSRSRWCRTLPIRPSSRSRIRGCSTSCASARMISANPCSSKPPPPTCSR